MTYLVQISVLLCLAAQIVRGEDCVDQNILSSGQDKGKIAVQVGLVTLINKNDGLRYQIYPVPHQPQIQFYNDQKTIGLNILYITGYLDKTGLDYSVKPIPFDKQLHIMLVMNVRARWVSVTVQYIISSHSDFVTGFFQVPNKELLYPTLNNTRLIEFDNKAQRRDRRLLGLDTNKVSIYFSICGIKYEQLDIQMQLVPQRYQIITDGSDILYIGALKLSKTTQPVELLYLSYFVYKKSSSYPNLFVGSSTSNFLGNSFDSVNKKMNFKQTSLAGITTINGIALKKFFDISSKPLKYVNSTKPTTSSPSPVTSANPAVKLNPTKRLLIDNAEFNPNLPPRARSVNSQVPRAVVNRLEAQGSISLAQFGVDDTIQLDQLIQELSANYQPYAGMTQAQVQAYDSSFGVSQFRRFRNELSGSIPRLGKQTQLDTIRKILNTNSKVCVTLKTCQQLSGKPIASSNNKFICKLCGENQRHSYDQDKCVCIKGFVPKGIECISPQSFCQKGQRYENGNCVSIQSSQIICRNKNGYILNAEKTGCECKQGLKQWVSKTGDSKCIVPCKGDLIYSQVIDQCKCPQGKTQSQGKCYECPIGKSWNAALKKCVCIGNAVQLDSGVCLICSTFGKFNSATSTCQCLPGYSGNGIVCKVAPVPIFSPRTQLSPSNLLPKRLGNP